MRQPYYWQTTKTLNSLTNTLVFEDEAVKPNQDKSWKRFRTEKGN